MEMIYSYSAVAGTTLLGAALSVLMITASRARYGVPSARKMSWNHKVGGRRV